MKTQTSAVLILLAFSEQMVTRGVEEVSALFDQPAHFPCVGIDIDANASKIVDLSRLETDGLLLGLTPIEPRKPGRARAV